MIRNAVFVDTVALIALANTRDALHAQAAALMVHFTTSHRRLITSEWVLSEFLAQIGMTPARHLGCEMIRRWVASPNIDILPASHDNWLAGFDLFASRPDKQWSHVDCTSMVLCRELAIEEVFTSDHHFDQAGLRVLLTT